MPLHGLPALAHDDLALLLEQIIDNGGGLVIFYSVKPGAYRSRRPQHQDGGGTAAATSDHLSVDRESRCRYRNQR